MFFDNFIQKLNLEYTNEILNQEFRNSLPSGWSVNNFIFSTGAVTNDSGSITSYLRSNTLSYLDRVMHIARVKFFDPNTILGIFRDDSIAGTMAKIDLSTKKLILCEMWGGLGSTPVNQFSSDIGFTFNIHNYYLIILKKKDGENWLIFKDEKTGQYSTLYYDNGPHFADEDTVGSQWGRHGIMNFSGSFIVKNSTIKTDFPTSPKVAMYGNSLIEGNAFRSISGDYSNRWCWKVYTSLNGNALISGRGGANSQNVIDRLPIDLNLFTPQYCIVFIGVNDSVYATWQANINSIISCILTNGSTPIICTLPPRDDRQTFLNSANDYILNTLSLSYDVIDFAAVLTDNGDRVTRISALYTADNIHPNVDGNLAMYNEIVNNHSYLL